MIVWVVALCVSAGLAFSASKPADSSKPATPAAAKPAQAKSSMPPGCLEVQHVLISFDGAPRVAPPGRTKEQAEKLAHDVLTRAKAGEDFLALVEKYTSDRPPGIYRMCDRSPAPPTFVPRNSMVPGFGDVSFSLKPGEIGMASYDPQKSPYGWHIIKRLR
jgi:foldase protein PrsA